jgi:hypothetical protein
MTVREPTQADNLASRPFRRKLTAGFRNLRRKGWFAKQNWCDCQSCGRGAIPNTVERFAFYHQQVADDIDTTHSVYLYWEAEPDEIVDELIPSFVNAGLHVEWNGDPNQAVLVSETRTQ